MRYRNDEPWYDTMLVCENGHIITSLLKTQSWQAVKQCPTCGAVTISQCLKCRTEIRGYKHIPGHIFPPDELPEYCHECGEPYPWTSKGAKMESEFPKNRTVFIAHSFKEEKLVSGLKKYLEMKNIQWVEGRRQDLGSISGDILTKIKESGFFLAVMTKRDKIEKDGYTVSSWLLEEKGAALAYGHRPLIMVEEGVDRHYVGFLQGDDQLIYFERDEFSAKMIETVEMILRTLEKTEEGEECVT